MKLEFVKEFVFLARELNYSKTADLLFVSQSALSRHIDLLEEELGVKLLSRTTRTVKLTDAGEKVLEAFSEIWDCYEKLQSDLRRMTEDPDSTIVLSTSETLFASFFSDYYSRLNAKYPNLKIRFDNRQPGEAYLALAEGTIDLAIAYAFLSSGTYAKPNIGMVLLKDCTDACCIILNPKCSLCRKKEIKSSDLANLTLVLMEDEPSSPLKFNAPYNDYIVDVLRRNGVRVQHVKKVQSPLLLLGALDTNMFAIFPRSVSAMLNTYGMKVVELDKEQFPLPVALYYKKGENQVIDLVVNETQAINAKRP